MDKHTIDEYESLNAVVLTALKETGGKSAASTDAASCGGRNGVGACLWEVGMEVCKRILRRQDLKGWEMEKRGGLERRSGISDRYG